MSEARRLRTYAAKRDFEKTPEPPPSRSRKGKDPMFVVQHHMATREHYDVRLEVEGVLASWAVPKGPSYDPADRRLAIKTEDHPKSYAAFEGVIPKGEYGGGTVMVWDAGIFRNMSVHRGRPISLSRAIETGHVKVWFEGAKLRGGWALVRMEATPGKEQWLMIKHRDEFAHHTVPTDVSILTGRSMEDIASQG